MNRWPNRQRRKLLASDLASILNAIVGEENAVEDDALLRSLGYAGTWPDAAEQVPHLGEHRWGELLERLICGYTEQDGGPDEPSDAEQRRYPDSIEVCMNPLGIDLIWLRPDETRERVDYYRPNSGELVERSRPYGPAVGLVRKSFLSPQVIRIAGLILRDTSPREPSNPSSASTSHPGGHLT